MSRLRQRFHDQRALDVLEIHAPRRQVRWGVVVIAARGASRRHGQVLERGSPNQDNYSAIAVWCKEDD